MSANVNISIATDAVASYDEMGRNIVEWIIVSC